jgi:hypothetical protein
VGIDSEISSQHIWDPYLQRIDPSISIFESFDTLVVGIPSLVLPKYSLPLDGL